MELKTLKDFTAAYYQTQRQRIRTGNMIYAAQREAVLPFLETKTGNAELGKEAVEEMYEKLKSQIEDSVVADVELRKVELKYDELFSHERGLEKVIKDDIQSRPLYADWLQYVRGISHLLTASFMSYIYDISRFDTISKLWQYAGYGVMNISKVNGVTKRWFPTRDEAEQFVDHAVELEQQTAERFGNRYDVESKTSNYMDKCIWGIQKQYETIACKPLSGLPSLWHPGLKTTGWKFSDCIQRQSADKSKYRKYYDEVKACYKQKHAQVRSPGHINNMTKRKVTKLFLSHLWIQWRKLEGLPISKPYCIEHMEHNDYIEPFYDIEPDA